MAGTSVERPLPEFIENNLRGLVEVYEGARRHGTKRTLFAGSNHAMGTYPMEDQLALDCAFRPDGFYGLSKAWSESLARLYWDKHGIETVNVRIVSCLPKPTEFRHLSMWFGHDDLFHLDDRVINVESIGFAVVCGVSNNTRSYWVQGGANDDAVRLAFKPQQNAEDYAAEILAKGNLLDAVAQRYQGGSFASIDLTPKDKRGKHS